MNIFSSSENAELKEAIDSISHFPPLRTASFHIATFPPFNEKNSEISFNVEDIELERIFWYWTSKSLDAFFNDKSDPLSDSETTEEITQQLARLFPDLPLEDIRRKKIKALEINSTKYRIFANLIFEGEKFIKADLEKLGFPLNFKRSDILKQLAFEECTWRLMELLYDWESLSLRQILDRLRQWKKYKTGQIKEEKLLEQIKIWDKEDQKLLNTLPPFEKVCSWTHFCLCAFEKYSKELPSYPSLQAFEEPPSSDDIRMEFKKSGHFGGEYKEHSTGKKS